MSQKANPALIGAFVLCGVLLAICAVVVFGSGDLFKFKVPCVMYFDGNINGLNVGSQVKLRGVAVGSVIGIDMPIQTAGSTARIPVYAELTPPRTYTKRVAPVTREEVEEVIAAGLRARLETESFVTGVLYIGLDFLPDEPEVLIGDAPEGFLEIPTLPPRVTEVIEKLLTNLNDIDIKGMVRAIESAACGVDELVRSRRVEQGIVSLDQTLTSYRELATSFDANLKSRSEDLQATMAALRSAVQQVESAVKAGEDTLIEVKSLAHDLRGHSEKLVGAVQDAAKATQDVEGRLATTLATLEVLIDPKAPLVEQLRETLTELARASRSLSAFASELQGNPSALLRGRDVEGKQP